MAGPSLRNLPKGSGPDNSASGPGVERDPLAEAVAEIAAAAERFRGMNRPGQVSALCEALSEAANRSTKND